eukprot:GFUD01034674.1.p1 GENE.GFUD01034674.1~~GFUD01034674.1.p1  ORF type:complete len:190 (-),score=73.55 GFUD01034674.1:147-716(-)
MGDQKDVDNSEAKNAEEFKKKVKTEAAVSNLQLNPILPSYEWILGHVSEKSSSDIALPMKMIVDGSEARRFTDNYRGEVSKAEIQWLVDQYSRAIIDKLVSDEENEDEATIVETTNEKSTIKESNAKKLSDSYVKDKLTPNVEDVFEKTRTQERLVENLPKVSTEETSFANINKIDLEIEKKLVRLEVL